MTANDIAVIVRVVAPLMREQSDLVASLQLRLAALEQQSSMTPAYVLEASIESLQRRVLAAETHAQALESELAVVKTASVSESDVAERIKSALDTLPPPIEGKNGQDGKDGTSVTVEDVAPVIIEQVKSAMAALPLPIEGKDGKNGQDGKDGTSVTVDDVAPLITHAVEKAVGALPVAKDGKDGVGLTGALIDRDGHLIVTLSDGTTKSVGNVIGRDGQDVDLDQVRKTIEAEVAKIPVPKDGKDGQDGKGFDSMEFAHDEQGRLGMKFTLGDVVKFTRLPGLYDRGVWRDGEAYLKGDAVRHGGSLFLAQVDHPTAKPESDEQQWRLAVKRGRDGKDGAKGLDGKNGRDGGKT